MKKMILLSIVGLYSLQFYSQNSTNQKQSIDEIKGKKQIICGVYHLEPEKNICFSLGTLEELLINLEVNIPSFRAIQASVPNQPLLLKYRNCVINDVYVDGVRCDVSILQSLNPNSIESIQVFNSIMESDIYSSNSKKIKS